MELVDLALVSATFSVPTQIFLEGPGVLHAHTSSMSDRTYALTGRLDSVTLYDMAPVIVDGDSLAALGLTKDSISLSVTILERSEFINRVRTADVLLEA